MNSSEVKQRNQYSQGFHLNCSEVENFGECSKRFHLNRSEVKHCIEGSHRFHINSSEVKQPSGPCRKFYLSSNEVIEYSEHNQVFLFNREDNFGRKVRQCIQRSQKFGFSSSDVKKCSDCSQRSHCNSSK